MSALAYDAVVLGASPAGEVACRTAGLAEPGVEWPAVASYRDLAILRDSVAQFPTFTEAYLKGFEQL